jgi:Flp pilus assembly pilin Flp
MEKFLGHLAASTEGTTSIEYALIGSLIAVAIVFLLAGVGDSVQKLFQTVSDILP